MAEQAGEALAERMIRGFARGKSDPRRAHGQGGPRVFEDLLEAQEFEDAEVDAGVEAQPAFEGAQGAVELHPEAAVDAQPAGVVLPGDAEENLAFRLDDAFEDLRVAVVAVAVEHGRERFEHLARGLEELRLAGIAARHPCSRTSAI